ncbi:hypothetical protein [Glycomyces tenuis]|nr:hypothetical protein [Glycomyces tenuis]
MNLVPDLAPDNYALLRLMLAHLRHLEKKNGERLSAPQWTIAAQSAKTVAAAKFPGHVIDPDDIPMIIGTGAPGRHRHLYTSMPCPPSVAAAADESDVAIFIYNRRGRIQPANRTATARQPRPWYPPAKADVPMGMMSDAAWGPVEQAIGETDTMGDETGRPGVFEAAAGWLVLLVFLVFLAGSAYLALWFFDIV